MATNLEEAAEKYANATKAKSTKASYGEREKQFAKLCKERGEKVCPANPKTVALHVAQMAEEGFAVSTINQFLSTISDLHVSKGLVSPRFDPEVQRVWKGVRRTLKVRAVGMKPLLLDQVKAMLAATPPVCLINHRDRALLAFGWSTANRRHEIADTRVENVTFHEHGFTVLLPSSKTDQEGEGFEKMVLFGQSETTCPVLLVKRWLAVSGLESGPMFRPINRWGRIVEGERVALWPQYVDKIVKKMMRRGGLDPKGYGAHSLRAGFVTQAALMGKTESEIMRHTGHGNNAMVRRYIRVAELHKYNATRGIGL